MIYLEKDKETIESVILQCDSAFGKYEMPISQREYYTEYVKKIADNASFFVVQDKQLMGCAAVYVNDQINRVAYLSLIAIRPEFQGQGVGRKLLEQCINYAIQNNMKDFILEVKMDNIEAIGFYQKNGFEIKDKASKNSFYMSKRIGS